MKACFKFIITAAAFFTLYSCASVKKPDAPRPPPETCRAEDIAPPAEKKSELSLLEKMRAVVKENRRVEKHTAEDFTPSACLVRGRFIDADFAEYEVVYDLASAPESGDGGYIVPFVIMRGGETLARDSFVWEPRGGGGAGVLLSFDDDYTDSWEGAFPLFEKYNARVTFFLKGSFNDFAKKANARGHEAAYHTKSHTDLRKLSVERFFAETTGELEVFRKNGVEIASFAYPFGFFDNWMNETLAGVFKFLRGFGTKLVFYDKNSLRSAFIKSKSIDNAVYKDDEEFYGEILLILKVLKFCGNGKIVSFTTHDINRRADWGITGERLEFVLKSTREFKLEFYTFRDLERGKK